jgi:hypothetical protein
MAGEQRLFGCSAGTQEFGRSTPESGIKLEFPKQDTGDPKRTSQKPQKNNQSRQFEKYDAEV